MKTKYFIMFLFLSIYVSNTGVAQIELPEGTANYLEKYNKEQNEKETQDKGETAKQAEKEKAWEKMFEDSKEEFNEAASYFNTQGLNCIFLTVLYLDGYMSLVELTNSEENCPRKYDLLGTQVVAIGMSTMILYCPEYLSSLTEAEKDELISVQLKSIGNIKDENTFLNQWFIKFGRVLRFILKNRPLDDVSDGIIDDLTRYFRPEWIVTRSLRIAREMEALGCGDY